MKSGEKIAKLAKEKDLNLHQLAVKSGVPYNTVYAIVRRNSNKIDVEIMKKLAEVLGVFHFELYGDSEKEILQEGYSFGLKTGINAPYALQRTDFLSEFREKGYSFFDDERRLVSIYNNELNESGQVFILSLLDIMKNDPKYKRIQINRKHSPYKELDGVFCDDIDNVQEDDNAPQDSP